MEATWFVTPKEALGGLLSQSCPYLFYACEMLTPLFKHLWWLETFRLACLQSILGLYGDLLLLSLTLRVASNCTWPGTSTLGMSSPLRGEWWLLFMVVDGGVRVIVGGSRKRGLNVGFCLVCNHDYSPDIIFFSQSIMYNLKVRVIFLCHIYGAFNLNIKVVGYPVSEVTCSRKSLIILKTFRQSQLLSRDAKSTWARWGN